MVFNYLENDKVLCKIDNKVKPVIIKDIYKEDGIIFCKVWTFLKHKTIKYTDIISLVIQDGRETCIKWADGEKSFGTIVRSDSDIDKKYGHYSYIVKMSEDNKRRVIFYYQIEPSIQSFTVSEYGLRTDPDFITNL